MMDDLWPYALAIGALFLALDLASFYVIWRVSLRLRVVQALAARAESVAGAASVTATATESKIAALDTRVTHMEQEIRGDLTELRGEVAQLRGDVTSLARRADLLELTELMRRMIAEGTGREVHNPGLTFNGPAQIAGPVAGSIGAASMGAATTNPKQGE